MSKKSSQRAPKGIEQPRHTSVMKRSIQACGRSVSALNEFTFQRRLFLSFPFTVGHRILLFFYVLVNSKGESSTGESLQVPTKYDPKDKHALPFLYMGDYEPHGVQIFLTFKEVCPKLQWLGLHESDVQRWRHKAGRGIEIGRRKWRGVRMTRSTNRRQR